MDVVQETDMADAQLGLSVLQSLLSSRLHCALRRFGLSPSGVLMVDTIARNGGTMPATALRDAIGMSKANCCEVRQTLERSGWVVARVNLQDKRQRIVSLGERAVRELELARQARDQVFTEILGGLPEEFVRTLKHFAVR